MDNFENILELQLNHGHKRFVILPAKFHVMDKGERRIEREKKTIDAMIGLYCHDHHGTKGKGDLCEDCQNLLNYAFARIGHCVFNPDKPTCKNCTIHCYAPAKKEKIKEVMRYSGPRMMLHKPVLAIAHLLDGKKDDERIQKYLEKKAARKQKAAKGK
jgi:hypothetical protein